MIARMLLVFLLVLNLGVAAWWALHRPAQPTRPVPLDPAVPTLELVDTPSNRPPTPTTTITPVPAEAVQPTPAEEANPSTPEPTPIAMACASFGPYADAAAAQAARGRLGITGAQSSVRSIAGASARGYNVYMPPLPSRDEAVAMTVRLRAAGFNDLMLMSDGDTANGIALGRFGAEDNARRHQAALQAKGFAAQIAPIGGASDGSTHWVDVRAPAGFDQAAARSRLGAAQVQSRDCPA